MRGKPGNVRVTTPAKGITPADAGKTAVRLWLGGFGWDHPRRCGENCLLLYIQARCRGSPPQVRGKLSQNEGKSVQERITPAGAGKTGVLRASASSRWDHPRRCGENVFEFVTVRFFIGSPPQVRGKQFAANVRALPTRITPAGAGKTRTGASIINRQEDHPRRCGEN